MRVRRLRPQQGLQSNHVRAWTGNFVRCNADHCSADESKLLYCYHGEILSQTVKRGTRPGVYRTSQGGTFDSGKCGIVNGVATCICFNRYMHLTPIPWLIVPNSAKRNGFSASDSELRIVNSDVSSILIRRSSNTRPVAASTLRSPERQFEVTNARILLRPESFEQAVDG